MTDRKQFWSGIVFLIIGAGALWTTPHPLGRLAAMGPGYFPMILGVGLVLTGLIAIGLSARSTTSVERFPVLPACFVLGGVVAVALLIAERGVAISLAILVATSCYNRLLKRPLEPLIIYAVLLPLTWVIFVYAVQLPISLY